ncbi:hypothetical protein BHE74_00037245 [Ensete ventricosum]|uniref:Uncharacterized protein n=1 Tax=Ensete ventricosum TaxID=4639 RepID=A0A426YCB9_ENSVE|nr:hypothetical protein B296_00023340 [Ensete ventricosum]RWW14201.1 hypothetical protein GW17_00022042 [Ensete ventricosum]RWW56073.1 hypothetical protein BHE74_00037245 [Ensete ventricosum]RZS03605.1 hypothetical protein BHM03_00033792 [Ensete ventricosum]
MVLGNESDEWSAQKHQSTLIRNKLVHVSFLSFMNCFYGLENRKKEHIHGFLCTILIRFLIWIIGRTCLQEIGSSSSNITVPRWNLSSVQTLSRCFLCCLK